MPPKAHPQLVLILLAAGLLATFTASLSIGSADIPPGSVLRTLLGSSDSIVWRTIVIDFRVPKALACVVAGAALALGGLLMQTLFRNPLAGPDVMGLSSGASLAVSLSTLSGLSYTGFTASPWLLAGSATLGSGLVFLLMLLLSLRVRDHSGLLILGLMVGAFTSSMVGILEYVSNAEDLQFFIFWTLGRVGGLHLLEIAIIAMCVMAAVALSLSQTKSLNVWSLGSRYAESLGVKLDRARIIILTATSLLVGSVTAFCGPIAFIGVAVPHLVRPLLRNAHHTVLIPGVMLAGSILLLVCDIICQLPGDTQALPLNAVCSLLGAPIVISVILKMRRLAA